MAKAQQKREGVWRGGAWGQQRTAPQLAISTRLVGLPALLPCCSILRTTSIPDTTRPNTTCFPARRRRMGQRGLHSYRIANVRSKGPLVFERDWRVWLGQGFLAPSSHGVFAVQMKNCEPAALTQADIRRQRSPPHSCVRSAAHSRIALRCVAPSKAGPLTVCARPSIRHGQRPLLGVLQLEVFILRVRWVETRVVGWVSGWGVSGGQE